MGWGSLISCRWFTQCSCAKPDGRHRCWKQSNGLCYVSVVVQFNVDREQQEHVSHFRLYIRYLSSSSSAQQAPTCLHTWTLLSGSPLRIPTSVLHLLLSGLVSACVCCCCCYPLDLLCFTFADYLQQHPCWSESSFIPPVPTNAVDCVWCWFSLLVTANKCLFKLKPQLSCNKCCTFKRMLKLELDRTQTVLITYVHVHTVKLETKTSGSKDEDKGKFERQQWSRAAGWLWFKWFLKCLLDRLVSLTSNSVSNEKQTHWDIMRSWSCCWNWHDEHSIWKKL